jgi:nitrile hydratase
MNGIHDMGGMMGFGPVEAEADEPVFHSWWEGRVYALGFLASRVPSIDASRHTTENRSPLAYLTTSYYGRWLEDLEDGLIEAGAITRKELASGRSVSGRAADARAVSADTAEADCFARQP